jgi:TolB-like protein/Tfp pilus assembly protein PilF
VVVVLVAAALAAALWLGRRGDSPGIRTDESAERVPVGAPAPITSLAVLPLDNHSPGDDEQYFADGMTEALIAEIAQIADLRVISRTSVMQYRKNRPPLRQVADELDVDAVVEGSILRAGGRIRIIAQLVRTADDAHIWAGTYERDHERVLALQREVATAVAVEIQGALRPGAARLRSQPRSVDPEAHVLLLRGWHDLELGAEASIRRGLEQFRSALEIDPAYAQAWVGIARAYSDLANTYVPPREAMPQAKTAVLRALAIDPGLAEAYIVLSDIQRSFEWNFEESERSVRRALEINPKLPAVVMAEAWQEMDRGNRERAFELVRKARMLDPLSPGTDSSAFLFHWLSSRDYESALEIGDDLAKRFPSNSSMQFMRALALESLDRKEEAVAAAVRVVELDGSIFNLAVLARAQAVAGQEDAARETLVRMEKTPSVRYQCPYETALSWSALEEFDKAHDLLEQGIEERAVCWSGADADPRVDTIREFPWFQDLLARRTPMGPDDPDYVEIPPDLGLSASSSP